MKPDVTPGLCCPSCGSTNAVCDGRLHRCHDCGYDGTTQVYGARTCEGCGGGYFTSRAYTNDRYCEDCASPASPEEETE